MTEHRGKVIWLQCKTVLHFVVVSVAMTGREHGTIVFPTPKILCCRKMFLLENFCLFGAVEILSTHSLLCRKFFSTLFTF